jgi:anthranilate phosphoribosyltransferase
MEVTNKKAEPGSIRKILGSLFEYHQLSRNEATTLMHNVTAGKFNESEIASLLTVYMMRNISIDELLGFRDALLELCVKVDLSDFKIIDLCGTGGDGKNTFNISTLASFVVAGAGGKVAKHGNYGVSSACGSSNVMEYYGYKFKNNNDQLKNELEKTGICFLHAPFFHPALKAVGPVRKQLGLKTFFNMLGPLVNPAFPHYQITGVFNLELARLYHYLNQSQDKNYVVIYNLDGYDEISLTGSAKIFSNTGEKLIEPKDFGFEQIKQEDIFGGKTVEEAALIFMNVLKNKATKEQQNVVIANSAMALHCLKMYPEISECVEAARDSLHSGKAYQSFVELIKLQ